MTRHDSKFTGQHDIAEICGDTWQGIDRMIRAGPMYCILSMITFQHDP